MEIGDSGAPALAVDVLVGRDMPLGTGRTYVLFPAIVT